MSPSFWKPAPIVLFIFARPHHVRRTIESLRVNRLASQSDLIVYADGPRGHEDDENVRHARAVARAATGFASVTMIERPSNVGLASNIIDGVTDVCERYGSAIVIEDDLLLSPHFLDYMNAALALYRDEERVASVHGYCYPTAERMPETFFLRGADCWGWATWSRAWRTFDRDGRALLRSLQEKKLCRRFDLDGAYPFTRMLKNQIEGRVDSWAIRWHASCFLQNRLTLYPGRSLVANIGNDGSGRHESSTSDFDPRMEYRPVPIQRIPLEESDVAREALARFFRASPLMVRVSRRIHAPRTKRIIKRLIRLIRLFPVRAVETR